MKKFARKTLCLALIFMSIKGIAQVPSNYYDSANGLTGSELKQELHDIISNGHTPISYNDLWTAFQSTDVDNYYENDGSVMDMYSEDPTAADPYNFSYTADQCGTYGAEGDCYNREHSFPKSWWGGSTSDPQYTDLNHLYPTDGYVNNKRQSYPYGEVSSPSWTSQNGCKLGNNDVSGSGYTGTVFEPLDEFKGDFARMLFYMATRYKDEIPTWVSNNSSSGIEVVFQSNGEFQSWYYDMLYSWHQNDPVSQKEKDRDDEVYNQQNNANPYITHPEWVCEVFGSCTVNPEPDNYPTAFSASAVSSSQIDLSWTDATGTNLPDYYLIKANTSESFTDPVDGTDPATDSDLSDGSAIVKVAHGSKGTYSFTGLSASTTYYFKIWSYANTGANIDFKTDGTAPTANATTLASTSTTTCEDFDNQSSNNYTTTSYSCNTGTWTCSDAGNFDYCNSTMGSPGFTINDDKSGAQITTPALNTCGTVTFNYAYKNGNSSNVFELQTSTDGSSFTTVDTHTLTSAADETWVSYSFDVNSSDNPIYIRVLSDNQNAHLFIDDFCWTDYTPSTPSLSVSPSSLSGFTYVSGNGPSAEQTFELTGTNLDGTDVTVSAPTSGNYEISKTSGSNFTTGTLTYSSYNGSSETIYVRLKAGLPLGTYNSDTIIISGGGASDVTVTLNGEVTANSSSDIILETTFTEPSNIPYINYQSTDIINDGNDIEVAQFTIRDGGGSSDADDLATTLTDISFALTNSAYIQRVAIYDGTTEIAETAGAATVTFSGITLTAPDNGSKTFSIRVSFNSTVTDNDQFQFTVTSATADATGSTFAATDAGGASSTITGDENRIEVVASALSFVQQPSNTGINNTMSPDPSVEAIDANSNRDLDYSASISVSSSGTMTDDPVSGTWSSGIATFSNLVHTALGTGLTLTANDGTLSVVSTTFDITDACANDLIISQINENGNDKYIEIANFTGSAVSLADYDVVLYSNGSTSVSVTIDLTDSGSIADGDVWVLAYSSAAALTPAADQTSGSFTPNGNDVIALRKSGSDIDVFGTIGNSSYWYDDQQYIRNSDITAPRTSYDANEWTSTAYGGGDPGSLGTHTMSCTCSEPSVESSNLAFANITASTMDLSWTKGDGLKRIVIACEGSSVSFVPVDNTTYTANASFGSGTDLGSGNYCVYNGSGNSFTITNLTPGTTYYFKIYEYGCSEGSEDYLTSGTAAEGNETTLPNDVTNFQVDCATATTANLSWTLPDGNYDGIMIAVLPAATPDNPTCAGNTLTNPITDFSSADVYCSNGSGAVYVYNNIGTSVSVTGLTSGTSYHFKAFTYKNSSWSVGSEIIQTAEVSDVSNLTSSCGNGESMISWTNPSASCFDEVMIIAGDTSITTIPSGDGSAYSADLNYGTGTNTTANEFVVYKGTTSPQTVTGLTNGTTYYFKVFVRNGTDWSAGTEVSCTATTATFLDYGDLAIVGINTQYIDYDNTLSDDEIQFVCFKDITPETSIDFTDNGYERLYAEKWADSEGTITLTRNSAASTIPAGTIITVRGKNTAANWHVFIGSGTPSGSLTNDDANWTITDGGSGNNVFDLNEADQIWMMQGGVWDNPSGAHNATYTGKVLYGWTATDWKPAPGYNSTKGSTIFPSSACSVTNVTGVQDSSKVRYNADVTDATQRDWLSRINNDENWSGYADSTSYQNGGTLPDQIGILGTGFSTVAKWTGETSTDWDDCTNWLNLKVPDSNTDVQFVSDDCQNDIVIQAGQTVICKSLDISGTTLTHSIKLEGDATAILEVRGDITIGGPAGVLDFDDGTNTDDGTLKVSGDWYENTDGAFLEGNSSVEFIGSVAQSINTVSSEAGFFNLKIDNSSATGVSLANVALVTGTLNLSGGILNLNGTDLTVSGEFIGTNGVFAGHQWSNLTVNGSGNINYGFSFATPQQLDRFTMNRNGQTAILATNLTLDDLQIDAGTVEMSAGKYFTINNSISNTPGTSGLILKSDATGTASLIQPSTNVAATCERYMIGGKWNYFFSPLDNVSTSIFNSGNPNFYWYNEAPADYWDATTIYGTTGWSAETAETLSVDKGYIQYHNATQTYNITGGNLYDPNNGSKVFTLSYTDNGSGSVGADGVTADWDDFEGWNFIGNPFTSAVDWNQVTFNNIENVVYFYDGSNYQYFGSGTSYNQGITLNGGSQFVPANQGVFVKATANNGTVTIPLAARTHDTQSFWKRSQTLPDNLIKLSIENNGFTDETIIRTLNDATENHDAKYDAYKLFSWDKSKPMLFSRNEDNSHFYAINTLPEFTDEKIIPLGMYIGAESYYTINLKDNNFNKMHIYLTDTKLNETVDLAKNNSYSFYQQPTDFSKRFYLHFKLNSKPELNSNIPDQTISVNDVYNYTVPNSLFTDKDSSDELILSAMLENGENLPNWLSFDSETRTFSGKPENIQEIHIVVKATDMFGESVSDVYTLTVSSASFIPEVTNNDVFVYPNPTDGKFVIEFMKPVNGIYMINDISGKILMIDKMKSNRTEIDLSRFGKGIYIVSLKTENRMIKKRVILK